MFVVTYLDTATGLYNAEPFFEEEGAQGSVEAHKQFEDRYKEIKIREMTKEQFDELESEDFYDEFVTKGTIPGIETSGEEEEEMSLKEAFEEMAKVDIAPVEDTEVFVDNDIVKEDEPTVDGTPSGPEEGTDTTIANLIIKAINGEWETIDEYNSLVSALHQANLEEFIPVIEDITNEEHKHIGQLQECLKKISPNTESIESGEEEGAKQLKENLEDMPKLKLNESMEDLDELVADKELCAHADIPLRIATDWIFRKNLQKQHEELFKDKEKKLAEFIKKQDNREPKLELKESLFEAADVRSMKRKAIKEALDKINSMKKSLKEGYGQSYYADGQDALQKVIETAKDMLDEDGIDEAVQYAIDNDLIYTDDIVALCVYYGVLDESEVINQMYELLYNDVYTAVSEYAEEQEDETQEESFRGIRHSKRGLKESVDPFAYDIAENIAREIRKVGMMGFEEVDNLILDVYDGDLREIEQDVFTLLNYEGINTNYSTGDFYTDEYAEEHPEVLEESKKSKRHGKRLRESRALKESNYRGAKGIKFVSHGAWSDPELIYKGRSFNYWDIEDALWSMFLEETGHTDNESNDTEVEAEFDEYVQAHAADYLEDVIAGGYFEESKSLSRRGVIKPRKELRESKSLMEGPGAGYTIEGTLRNVSITNYKVVSTSKDKSTGDRYTDVVCDVTGTADFDDISANSYYYGCEVESTPVEIVGITASFLGEPDEFTAKDIEDDLNGVEIEGIYGGGWSHATFDGDLTATVQGDSYLVYDVTIQFKDKVAMKFIDSAVKGPEELFGLSDDERTIEDAYEDEDEAIELAKKHGYEYVVRFNEYRTKLYADGESEDSDIEIIETVWERPEEEDEEEDEEDDDNVMIGKEMKNESLTEARNSTDKFTAVYDELVSSKAGKTPFRKLKNKEEDRYDYSQVNYDDEGIIVRADSEEELDFAKEVAKAWNCETVVKNDRTMKHPFGLVLKVDEKEKVSK